MTRLFDHDDWSRFDSPEVNAPSFLTDSLDSRFEPIRDTIVATAVESDIPPSSDNVVDVLGPSYDDGSRRSSAAPRELTAAPSSPSGWYSDWSAHTETSYPQENSYDAGIDLRPDTRYDSYDPYRPATQETWDPLTDPWPADQRLEEPRLADLRPSTPWSPEPPVAQNLVYPEAGFSQAQYVETRYVETQYVEKQYIEKQHVEEQHVEEQHVEARALEPQQPAWLREGVPSVPAQSRFEDPAVSAVPTPISAAPAPSYLPAPVAAPEPAPRSVDPQEYDVVLPGPLGDLEIGFRDANWYSLSSHAPRRLRIREVLASHPQHAGSLVQVVCWWMRENSGSVRALDLATELALAVSDFARVGTGVRRAS